MGTVGGLASLVRPEPLRIRLGSRLAKYIIATIFNLPRRSTFSSRQVRFLSFFSHRDERLRQHGVAAASSSPGRTDDSAILGQLRIRSVNQLTYYQTQMMHGSCFCVQNTDISRGFAAFPYLYSYSPQWSQSDWSLIYMSLIIPKILERKSIKKN